MLFLTYCCESPVYLVEAQGWRKMFAGDMNELHYGQYAQERAVYEKRAPADDEKVDDSAAMAL